MIRKIFRELCSKVLNLFSFCCMVFLLGIQTLLEGSWRVPEVDNNKKFE